MQRLVEGIHSFRAETFGASRELFNRPSRNGQQPLTLVTAPTAGEMKSLQFGSKQRDH